jgi:hypothetical protein
MKSEVRFIWTDKKPTALQLQKVSAAILEEFQFHFHFQEYQGKPWHSHFHGGEAEVLWVLGQFNDLRIGAKAEIQEYRGTYLSNPYLRYNECALQDSGVQNALSLIQQVLEHLPPAERQVALSILTKRKSNQWDYFAEFKKDFGGGNL